MAIDRAGIVGEDGETHQGVFDAAFLNGIPGVTIFAPSYYDELEYWLEYAVSTVPAVSAVRYPRGKSLYRPATYQFEQKPWSLYGEVSDSVLLVTYGKLFSYAAKAADELRAQGIPVSVLKLNRIKPLEESVFETAIKARSVYFFEEGMESGGIGEHFLTQLVQKGYLKKTFLRGIGDYFIKHASMEETLAELGLDTRGIMEAGKNGEGETE